MLLSCIQALLPFRLESCRVWLVTEVISLGLAASSGWIRLCAVHMPVPPTRAILTHPRLGRRVGFLGGPLLSQGRARLDLVLCRDDLVLSLDLPPALACTALSRLASLPNSLLLCLSRSIGTKTSISGYALRLSINLLCSLLQFLLSSLNFVRAEFTSLAVVDLT